MGKNGAKIQKIDTKVFIDLHGYQKKRIDHTSTEKQSLGQSDPAFSSYRCQRVLRAKRTVKTRIRPFFEQHRLTYHQKRRICTLFLIELVSDESDKIWRSYGQKYKFAHVIIVIIVRAAQFFLANF